MFSRRNLTILPAPAAVPSVSWLVCDIGMHVCMYIYKYNSYTQVAHRQAYRLKTRHELPSSATYTPILCSFRVSIRSMGALWRRIIFVFLDTSKLPKHTGLESQSGAHLSSSNKNVEVMVTGFHGCVPQRHQPPRSQWQRSHGCCQHARPHHRQSQHLQMRNVTVLV